MARRPIFLPELDPSYLVFERYVDFTWSPGMALSQRQKSITDLHRMAKEKLGVERPLEVSSKSENEVGVALSSFNLRFTTDKGLSLTVECAFQGSKIFEFGGPFRDLFFEQPMDAKRDSRLKNSGPLTGFSFFRQNWPLNPPTAFYDWVYVNALVKNPDLAAESMRYDAYTDIEFNPERSINCQARSVALHHALSRLGTLEEALSSPDAFKSIYNSNIAASHFYRLQKSLV